MQTGPLACGDEESGRACALGLWNADVTTDAKCNRDAVYGLKRLRAARFEITAGDSDAQPRSASLEQRTDRLCGAVGARRVVGVEALHGIISKGQILDGSRHRPDMVEAGDERKASRATEPTIGWLQAENPAA